MDQWEQCSLNLMVLCMQGTGSWHSGPTWNKEASSECDSCSFRGVGLARDAGKCLIPLESSSYWLCGPPGIQTVDIPQTTWCCHWELNIEPSCMQSRCSATQPKPCPRSTQLLKPNEMCSSLTSKGFSILNTMLESVALA